MVVLIFGDPDRDDEHKLIKNAVESKGEEARIINVFDWDRITPIKFNPYNNELILGESVNLNQISGVFVMEDLFVDTAAPEIYDLFRRKSALAAFRQVREWHGLLRSLLVNLRELGINVTLAPPDTRWDNIRPWMLEKFKKNNIPIPETIFTNDPDKLQSFMDKYSSVVIHYVNGGLHPFRIKGENIPPELMETLENAPMKIQEFIPGFDTRAYVVDQELVAVVMEDKPDPLLGKDAEREEINIEMIEPSEKLRKKVRKAANLTPSPYVAIDLRIKSPTHPTDFTILETNTSGLFSRHEVQSEANISNAIANYLISGGI